MKKVYKCLPAIIFSGFIAAMLILFLALPKQDFSEAERRSLEKAPVFTVKDYLSGKFEKNFETYLSDHTAGRTFWSASIPITSWRSASASTAITSTIPKNPATRRTLFRTSISARTAT